MVTRIGTKWSGPLAGVGIGLATLLATGCGSAQAARTSASKTPSLSGTSAAAAARLNASAPVAQQGPQSGGPIPVNGLGNAGATTTIQNPGVVSWVHFGDLHITSGDQQNYKDFQQIIQNTNQYLKNGVNFAVLPGDNANDSAESEYQLIKQATDQLQVPLYAVPGDHDLKSGNLSLYQKYLEPVPYQSFSADKYHFAFVDALDASASGGFGLSQDQMNWLTNDLNQAAQQGLQTVLFMHPYPGGLGNSAQAVQDLAGKDHVLMVDVGHTHYNDVANDGHTIYAATRSTGQATEGPVGLSISNLDNGVVSWKFKPLGSWPFVMITSPADEQLITDPSSPNQVIKGTVDLRSKIWDDKGVASATYSVDNGTPQPLTQIGTTQMWHAALDSTKLGDGDHRITVNVQGAGGNTSEDKITVLVNQAGSYQAPQRSAGATGNSIGAYAEKSLLGNHTAGGGGGGKGGPKGGNAACAPGGTSSTSGQATGSVPNASPSPSPASIPLPSASASPNPSSSQPACPPVGGPQGGGRGGKAGAGNAACTPNGMSGPNTAHGAPSASPLPSPSPSPAGSSLSSTNSSFAANTAQTACPAGGAAQGGGRGGPKGSGGNAAPAAGSNSGTSSTNGAPAGPGGPKGGAGGAATITAITGNTLTLQLANGSTQQVAVGSSTTIVKEVAGAQSDLKPGEKVEVQSSSSNGSLTATTIEIPKQ